MSWSFSFRCPKADVGGHLNEALGSVVGAHNLAQFSVVRVAIENSVFQIPTRFAGVAITAYGHASEQNFNYALEVKACHLHELVQPVVPGGNDDPISAVPPEAA